MRIRAVSDGLKYVTRDQISAYNRDTEEAKGAHENVGFWPNHRTNMSLKALLCEDVSCETCEVKCGFGKEYLKRVKMGKMSPRKMMVKL